METGVEIKFQPYIFSLFYHTSVLQMLLMKQKCINQNFTFLDIFPLNTN